MFCQAQTREETKKIYFLVIRVEIFWEQKEKAYKIMQEGAD